MTPQSALHTLHSALLSLLLPLALLGCEELRGPQAIRLSLIHGEESHWFQGAAKWKELVEAQAPGRYQIEIIPGAERSGRSQATQLQMLRQGQLDACLESAVFLATLDPRWTAFAFPWLFPDQATADAVCDGPIGEELLKHLADYNLVGLACGANGFRQITNNLRPIRAPNDLKSLTIAIPHGLPPQVIECFGAHAIRTEPADLLPALERNEVNGQENPLATLHAAKLRAAQKHLTLWDYAYDPLILLVNRDVWYSLSGPDQRLLREAARQAMRHTRRLAAEADASLPAALEAEGMTVTRLKPIEKDALKVTAQAAVRKHFEATAGNAFLERLEDAVERAARELKAREREAGGQSPE